MGSRVGVGILLGLGSALNWMDMAVLRLNNSSLTCLSILVKMSMVLFRVRKCSPVLMFSEKDLRRRPFLVALNFDIIGRLNLMSRLRSVRSLV